MRRQYSLETSGRNHPMRRCHFPETAVYNWKFCMRCSYWVSASAGEIRILSAGRGRRWEVRGRAQNCIVRLLMTCTVQQSKNGWVATEGDVHQRNKNLIQSSDKNFWRKETSWKYRVKTGSSLVQWAFEDRNSFVETVINPLLNRR